MMTLTATPTWSTLPACFRGTHLGSLQRRIPRERDPVRRQLLLLNYVRHGGADSLVLRRALDEIPPESPLWGLSPMGPEGPLGILRRATGRSSQVREYAEKGSETNPDREVRAGFLAAAMSEAEANGDKDRLGRYTTRMLEEFQGTFHAGIRGKRDAPDRKVRPGVAVADFAFSALEDSSQVIRIADFRGRHLLIDFWAVWCGPCRSEMPTLHRVREAFGERSLAMVSVSFDRRRADVAAYRRGKWAMPWLHAFASDGFAGKESATFDVWAIPKAILVAPDGTIVAEGNELRGEKLHQTLTRVIGEPGGVAPGK